MHNRRAIGHLRDVSCKSMQPVSCRTCWLLHWRRTAARRALRIPARSCTSRPSTSRRWIRSSTTTSRRYKVIYAIFEALYEIDYLSTLPQLAPLTAARCPGSRTMAGIGHQVRPGNLLHRRPRVGGKRRELVAEDYVYSLKRWIDPTLRRGGAAVTSDLLVGARAVVDAAGSARRQVRLRPADRGTARHRPLHAATQAHRAQLSGRPRQPGARRRRARSCRGRRWRHSRPTRRDGTLSAARMATGLEGRPRGESRVSLHSLSRQQRSGARRARAQHEGKGTAAGGRGRHQPDRGRHASACWNSRGAASITSRCAASPRRGCWSTAS